VVVADIKGQVEAPQPPLAVMGEDIAAYGVNSISDLLDAISPQTGTGAGAGPPCRSSWSTASASPLPRIARLSARGDPPHRDPARGSGAAFGYSPDQRVVNFILKDVPARLRGGIARPDGGGTSTGGHADEDRQGQALQPSRADYTTLDRGERGISTAARPTVATDPDLAIIRTLTADTKDYTSTAPIRCRCRRRRVGTLTLNGTLAAPTPPAFRG
jgi:hypothetical protein